MEVIGGMIGDMFLFAIFALSFGLCGAVALFFFYRQTRKKGYRPVVASAVLLAGGVAGTIGTLAVPAHPISLASFLWSYFWVPLLLSSAAIALLVLILPRRQVRVFGERRVRFPFRRAGQSLIGLGVLLPLVTGVMCLRGLAAASSFSKSFGLTAMLVMAGQYLLRRGRSVRLPSVEEALRKDPRPPVLYLRAFNQESQFFIMGYKAEYGKWARSFHAALSKSDQKIGLTVEEYLSRDLDRSLGPFVALGSPEDYIAPPGALRLYAKDDDWKMQFDMLARRASAIIVEVSKSENLRWEFEHLRSEGLQEKLFVLTRPSTEGSKFAWAFWGVLWRVKGIRAIPWEEFSASLGHLGYEIGFDHPGFGAVLAFDAQGRAFVLTTEANWPGEFVEPIHAWIAERRRIGRCIHAICEKCGRPYYAPESARPVMCRDCLLGTTETQRTRRRIGWQGLTLLMCLSPVLVIVLLAVLFPSISEHWMRWISWIITLAFVLAMVSFFYFAERNS